MTDTQFVVLLLIIVIYGAFNMFVTRFWGSLIMKELQRTREEKL